MKLFLPMEATGILSSIAGISEILKGSEIKDHLEVKKDSVQKEGSKT